MSMQPINHAPNNAEPVAGGRSFVQLLSLGVFLWGALMMYPKTVDLLSHYSPDEFLGYVGLAFYWAAGSALLIEGVMVIMKIKTWISPARNFTEWAADIVLSIMPYLLSTLAQIFDGMYVQGTLQSQPPEIQLAITFLVPSLPALMIGMLILFSLYESAPAGLFGGSSSVGNAKLTVPKGFGIKKIRVGKLPWWMNPRNWKDANIFQDKPSANIQAKQADETNPTTLPTQEQPKK